MITTVSLEDFQLKSDSIIEAFTEELNKIRTGRAQTSFIEDVPVVVEAYGGNRMKIKELGLVSAPEPALLTVQVYDSSTVKDIEKAIQIANIGLNVIAEGSFLRLPIPPMTQERREQMVKLTSQKLEEFKVSLRTLRSDTKEDIENQKGESGVSEDDIKRDVEELQKMVDKVTETLELMAAAKQKELKTI